jgi:hypothetical protein
MAILLGLRRCLLLPREVLRARKRGLLLLKEGLLRRKECLHELGAALLGLKGELLLFKEGLPGGKEERLKLDQALPRVRRGLLKEKAGSVLLDETFPLNPQSSHKRTPHLPAVERSFLCRRDSSRSTTPRHKEKWVAGKSETRADDPA